MRIKDEIKAKVMSTYIGINVDLSKTQWYKQEAKLRNRFTKATLAGVISHKESTLACIQHNIKTQNGGRQWLNLSAFKLILKPLSSITDKEVLEAAKINGYKIDGKYKDYTVRFTKAVILGERCDMDIKCIDCYQYLISKGYDLPHYLLGGKTLKQAGLAIYK